MSKILVTGGAGYIGSHTSLLLLEMGYEVLIIDSLENSSSKVIERMKRILSFKKGNFRGKIDFIEADLTDYKLLKNIFIEKQELGQPINGVIHFAGLKAINESVNNPLKYWDINLLSTINLLKVMQSNNCNNFVFSSSAAVYGLNKNKLITEDSELMPINPYGKTKLTIENILKDLFDSSSNKWKIANLRYFNPIGSHPSGLIGENPLGKPNNIFPLIMQVASGDIDKLKIYGSDWPTKDGTGVRDYIHVMDVAEIHIKVLEFLMNNKPVCFSLNIGTGIGTSVLDLVKTFEKVNDVKVPYVFEKRRPGDASFVVADNSLLISKMNIVPKRNIEDMCKDGWKWKKLNPKGF